MTLTPAAARQPHRRRYWVWLIDHDAPADETGAPALLEPVLVTVTYADQLRGELEAGKAGFQSMALAPMNYATVWVWCAMVRGGHYKDKFQVFKAQDLGELEPLETAEELQEGAPPEDPS